MPHNPFEQHQACAHKAIYYTKTRMFIQSYA